MTRFNLPLWKYDKTNRIINPHVWLDERLNLFETYCLPSVACQSNNDFIWILLCDENTPVEYRDRIRGYKNKCPQIELIQVEEEYAWQFPRIFSEVVAGFLEARGANDGDICLTTYLDNDDALQKDFVQTVQNHVSKNINSDILYLSNTIPVFISFDYGIQYFTEMNMATRIKYPNNHFMTCFEFVKCINKEHKENDSKFAIGTCFGYGSHFLLEMEYGMCVEHIVDKAKPMWCEVIHHENVDNDVKMTFDTKVVRDLKILQKEFNVDTILQVCLSHFFIKVTEQIFRRFKGKFIKRQWK